MADYIVEIKDPVFRATPLAEANFEEDGRLVFGSKVDAQER